MLAFILQIINFFSQLPKPVQAKIIDTITDTLGAAFHRVFTSKKKEDLKQATTEAVTEATWGATRLSLSTVLPFRLPQKKRDAFAAEVVELVKSDLFIEVLDKRIAHIDTQNEEEYIYLCSVETRKLIVEMMDKAK